jgi:hypothetical protein
MKHKNNSSLMFNCYDLKGFFSGNIDLDLKAKRKSFDDDTEGFAAVPNADLSDEEEDFLFVCLCLMRTFTLRFMVSIANYILCVSLHTALYALLRVYLMSPDIILKGNTAIQNTLNAALIHILPTAHRIQDPNVISAGDPARKGFG